MLGQLLDRSHAAAGQHLRSIMSDSHRIPAETLVKLLVGVQVLTLATVTQAGEPRVAPVDGLFYRAISGSAPRLNRCVFDIFGSGRR